MIYKITKRTNIKYKIEDRNYKLDKIYKYREFITFLKGHLTLQEDIADLFTSKKPIMHLFRKDLAAKGHLTP